MGGILSMGDFSTCSRSTEQVRRIERGRYEDALASSTVPRGLVVLAVRLFTTCSRRMGAVTCSLPIKLCLLISFVIYKETAFGLYLLFFYKESTLFFGFYSGFTRGEYHIALVDFIVALRRTKGRRRRTLRSPSPPSSGLHLLTPEYPLRRGILAAAVYTNLGSGIPVQVAYPQFRIWFCFLCSGLGLSRFSRVVGLGSFVFHYWGDRSFMPAATCGFAMVFRRICADRDWVVCFCG